MGPISPPIRAELAGGTVWRNTRFTSSFRLEDEGKTMFVCVSKAEIHPDHRTLLLAPSLLPADPFKGILRTD
jgi:hypothetical protein